MSKKLSDLPQLSTPHSNDKLLIDDSTAGSTKYILASDLLNTGKLITAAALSTDSTWAWTAYTVIWTGVSTNPSIGNGSITGRYTQIGKTVFGTVYIKLGSTTTFGSGEWGFSLPTNVSQFSANVYEPVVGSAWGIRTNTSYQTGTARVQTTANLVRLYSQGSGNAWSNNTPVTWASLDNIGFNFTYEAA